MNLYDRLIKIAATVSESSCKKIYNKIYDQNGQLTKQYKNNFVSQKGNYICLKFNQSQQQKFIDAADSHVAWCVLSESFPYTNYLNYVTQKNKKDKKLVKHYGNYYYILQKKQPILKKCDDLPNNYKIDQNNCIYTQKQRQFVGKPLWKIEKQNENYFIINPKTKQKQNIKQLNKQLLNNIQQQIQQAKKDGFDFVENRLIKIQKKPFSYVDQNEGKKHFVYYKNNNFYNQDDETINVKNNIIYVQQKSFQLNPKCLVIIGQVNQNYHTQIRDTQDKFFTQQLNNDISYLLQKALKTQQKVFKNVSQNSYDELDSKNRIKLDKINRRLRITEYQPQQGKDKDQDEISKYIRIEKFFNKNTDTIKNAKFEKFNNIQIANIKQNTFFKIDNQIKFMFYNKQLFSLKRNNKLTKDIIDYISKQCQKQELQRIIYLAIQQNYIDDDTIQLCLDIVKDNFYVLTQLITRRYIFKLFPHLTKQDQLVYKIIQYVVEQDIKNNQLYYTFKMLQTTQKIGNLTVRQIIINFLKDNPNRSTAQLIKQLYDDNDRKKKQKNQVYAGYSDKVDKLRDMFDKLLDIKFYDQNRISDIINYIKLIAQAQPRLQKPLTFTENATKISSVKQAFAIKLLFLLQKVMKDKNKGKDNYVYVKKLYDQLLSQGWFKNFLARIKMSEKVIEKINKLIEDFDENIQWENRDALKSIMNQREKLHNLKTLRVYKNPFHSLYYYSNPNIAAKEFCKIAKKQNPNVLFIKGSNDFKQYYEIIGQLDQILQQNHRYYYNNSKERAIYGGFIQKIIQQFSILYPQQNNNFDIDKQCKYFMDNNVDEQQVKNWITKIDQKFDEDIYQFNPNVAKLFKKYKIIKNYKKFPFFYYGFNIILDKSELQRIKKFALYQVSKDSIEELFDKEYFNKIFRGRVKVITIIEGLESLNQSVLKNKDKKFVQYIQSKIKDNIDKLNEKIKNQKIEILRSTRIKINKLYRSIQ